MTSGLSPYGTWLSPITAEAITKGSNSIIDVLVDPVTSNVYHLENRPSEAGRSVLVETQTDKDVVGRDWNVRSAVHEYGGAPAAIYDGIVYFSNFSDGRTYKLQGDGDPEPVTPADKPYRYAAYEVLPTHPHLLVTILEDHTDDTHATVVNTLCVINTNTKTVHSLVSGTDFYACPTFSPNGKRLAWMQWTHPDMPWEGAEIHVRDVSVAADESTIEVKNDKHVAGKKEEVSASYPIWANDTTLLFTSDVSRYINPWKYDVIKGEASPLLPKPIEEDFGKPWKLGWAPFAVLDKEGSNVLFFALRGGRSILYLLTTDKPSEPQEFNTPYVSVDVIRTVSRDNQEVVFVGQRADRDANVVKCSRNELMSGDFKALNLSSANEDKFPSTFVSPPTPITLSVPPKGAPLHVVYHPPTNPAYKGSNIDGERPPCVVNVHGGPTALVGHGLDWKTQYFTSRGWGWLNVNYSGSSGYGRDYVERLAGNWGVADVEDCILAARTLSSAPYNLIDLKRLVIRGGSGGGYTALAAISMAKDEDLSTFAAVTSFYGISNLKNLADFTHKFESKYLKKLIGGTYEEVPGVFKARSPVHHADRIKVPLLILQGEIDRVVPKEQAEEIYESIKSRGGIVEYKLYDGEGHGWRKEENIRDALERELGFYEKIFGLTK
ncbi:alpha/beta-hydrolase [Crucibulum laeve]|uniref:Alpha/beta-hydrolase n=1 Tax=Crucibulum laeve TaxID=68775 RepID=A0A5C3M1I5_9AGAR|nr:alpha/beta-hydrolase [Crucibulum laeve]